MNVIGYMFWPGCVSIPDGVTPHDGDTIALSAGATTHIVTLSGVHQVDLGHWTCNQFKNIHADTKSPSVFGYHYHTKDSSPY